MAASEYRAANSGTAEQLILREKISGDIFPNPGAGCLDELLGVLSSRLVKLPLTMHPPSPLQVWGLELPQGLQRWHGVSHIALAFYPHSSLGIGILH
ncbi:hypothetical protein CDAR_232471 [Caerostris darwini]|uniref:Uncharacterized protein n=1 Tax=Caerostris darwini TaxID=1538125 RepID=A0AAV4W6M0_9ARAC|nr:hypothetical protein CDAR_232471 [Caerostris darwini]